MIWWDAHVQCAALRRHPLAQLLDHLLVVLWRNVSRMGVDGRQPLVCDWRERGAVLTWQAVEQRVLAGPRRADSTSVGHTVANDRTIPFWRRAPKWLHLGRLLGRFLGHVGSANPSHAHWQRYGNIYIRSDRTKLHILMPGLPFHRTFTCKSQNSSQLWLCVRAWEYHIESYAPHSPAHPGGRGGRRALAIRRPPATVRGLWGRRWRRPVAPMPTNAAKVQAPYRN